MRISILRTLVVCTALVSMVAGCDKATDPTSSGKTTGTPTVADTSSAAGTWSRTVGSAVETVVLGADHKVTMDSLTSTGSGSAGVRYTGTWTGTASSFSVTWSGYATTTDGATWSALVTLPSMTSYPFTVSGNTASVVVNGATRTYTRGSTSIPSTDVAAPTFTPAAGSFSGARSVQIATSTSGAQIRYTTDGSTPTSASPLYSAAVSVTATTTIKAVAIKDGKTSSVAMATFVIGSVDTATKPRDAGLVGFWMNIDIGTMAGESFKLDRDGQAMRVVSSGAGKTTFMYMGTWSSSAGQLDVSWAVAKQSPDGMSFTQDAPLPGAYQAKYTLSGNVLTLVSGGVSKAFQKSDLDTVDVVQEPTFAPPSGIFAAATPVAIEGVSGAKIHYTLDGSDPTASSPLYSSPVMVSASLTLKAIAIVDGTPSPIAAATYVVQSGAIVRDAALVGAWTATKDSMEISFRFESDGRYVMVASIDQAGTVFHNRIKGAWSTAQGKLSLVPESSEISQDGNTWMPEADWTVEMDVVPYSVSANSLVLDPDDDPATFRKIAP